LIHSNHKKVTASAHFGLSCKCATINTEWFRYLSVTHQAAF
jgi:hypothetical protein